MAKNKILIDTIRPHVKLYSDPKTGIAWVEDGTSGTGHSCHPNIDRTGSVRGMKSRGYWDKKDRTVRSHGWIYNIDKCVVSGDLDETARQHCNCGGACRPHSRVGTTETNKSAELVTLEKNCPICHKWIETDSKGKIMLHSDWLYNACKGGKSKQRSKIDV